MKTELALVMVSGEGMCAQECAHPLFSDERRARIQRLLPENAKKQSALAELACLAAMKISFGECRRNAYGYGENGKPYSRYSEYGFLSLAHAGECGACIWADSPVGMDIEEKNRDALRIMNRISAEKDNARENPIALWCAKESCAKLTGQGIGKPFCEIEAKSTEVVSDGKAYCLSEGETGKYVWAVCLTERRKIRVYCLSVREAISLIDA